jgi:Escherichia/Staphylococcus phage prohead protease
MHKYEYLLFDEADDDEDEDEALAALVRRELLKFKLHRIERMLTAQEIETKTLPAVPGLEWLQVKQVDMASGLVTGYASTYSLDLGKDEIAHGAFKQSLAEARSFAAKYRSNSLYPVLWQHKTDEPIGYISQAGEDVHGLRCTLHIDPDVPHGRQALAGLKNGSLSFSIGYRPVKYTYKGTANGTVRVLSEISLKEVSVVTFPMNPEARVALNDSPVGQHGQREQGGV